MAELEQLGSKYRIALRIIKDPRFERLTCSHKGTYADDCLVQRVTQVNKKTKSKSYDDKVKIVMMSEFAELKTKSIWS